MRRSSVAFPAVSLSLTASATANQYGAWVAANSTPLSIPINQIRITCISSADQMWVRVGVGTSSSAVQILAQDIESNNGDMGAYRIPIFVPAGATIYVAAASSTASATMTVNVSFCYDPDAFVGVGTETYYCSAANNLSRNIISAGTLVSMNGTTGHNIIALFGNINTNGAPIDFYAGPSGNQQLIASMGGNTSTDVAPVFDFFPVQLPSGVELWVTCSNTSVLTMLGLY